MSTAYNRMTLLLTDQDKQELIELVHHNKLSQCAVVRQLIGHAHRMQLQRQPTCADGRPCICPQAHGYQAPVPPDPGGRTAED